MTKNDIETEVMILSEFCKGKAKNEYHQADGDLNGFHYGRGTAYDVDKVVEQIEYWKPDEVLDDYDRGMNAMVKKAIKIVKGGGKDED